MVPASKILVLIQTLKRGLNIDLILNEQLNQDVLIIIIILFIKTASTRFSSVIRTKKKQPKSIIVFVQINMLWHLQSICVIEMNFSPNRHKYPIKILTIQMLILHLSILFHRLLNVPERLYHKIRLLNIIHLGRFSIVSIFFILVSKMFLISFSLIITTKNSPEPVMVLSVWFFLEHLFNGKESLFFWTAKFAN